MTWTWDPDTFGANWFNEGNDRMPAPLRYRSRFSTIEEVENHRWAVRAGYSADELEQIDLLMQTVARCEMRVEIIGSTVNYRDSDGHTQKQFRAVGAQTADHAAVLRQEAIHGEYGDITAQLLRPEQLPTALTATLPGCAPGTQGPESFHHDDLKPPTGYLLDNSHSSPRERFRRRTGRPTEGGGQAILRLGDFHARPSRFQAAQWYDITGDGRYIELRTPTHLDIRPATAPLFADIFGSWIGQAAQHLWGQQANQYR